jgi:hypothetical protein
MYFHACCDFVFEVDKRSAAQMYSAVQLKTIIFFTIYCYKQRRHFNENVSENYYCFNENGRE